MREALAVGSCFSALLSCSLKVSACLYNATIHAARFLFLYYNEHRISAVRYLNADFIKKCYGGLRLPHLGCTGTCHRTWVCFFWPRCPKQGIQFGLPLSLTGLKPVLNSVWSFEPTDFNRDCYKQQSYEATDGETWSFVGSNVPQLNESIEKMICKMNHTLNCGYGIQVKL